MSLPSVDGQGICGLYALVTLCVIGSFSFSIRHQSSLFYRSPLAVLYDVLKALLKGVPIILYTFMLHKQWNGMHCCAGPKATIWGFSRRE